VGGADHSDRLLSPVRLPDTPRITLLLHIINISVLVFHCSESMLTHCKQSNYEVMIDMTGQPRQRVNFVCGCVHRYMFLLLSHTGRLQWRLMRVTGDSHTSVSHHPHHPRQLSITHHTHDITKHMRDSHIEVW